MAALPKFEKLGEFDQASLCKKAYVVDELGDGSDSEGTSGEANKINLILAVAVVVADEAVGLANVLV